MGDGGMGAARREAAAALGPGRSSRTPAWNGFRGRDGGATLNAVERQALSGKHLSAVSALTLSTRQPTFADAWNIVGLGQVQKLRPRCPGFKPKGSSLVR